MHQPTLHIGLSAWIIQDGNYPDFEQGGTSRFALEFYSERGMQIAAPNHATTGLVHCRDAHYAARGVVRYSTEDVWIVDFGEVMAYCKGAVPRGIGVGDTVTGDLYLGIDPFFYFEKFFRIPGIPAIIYEWRIDGIEMETAPFVESTDHPGGKVLVRDHTKRARVPVTKTDAWKDDGGNGDYVLRCQRTSLGASRHINASDA